MRIESCFFKRENDHVYVYTKEEMLGMLDETEFRVSYLCTRLV